MKYGTATTVAGLFSRHLSDRYRFRLGRDVHMITGQNSNHSIADIDQLRTDTVISGESGEII